MMAALAPMLLAVSMASMGSSTMAWSAGSAVARADCIKAAGLTGATASSLVLFSDNRGAKTAVLINGRYRQSFLRNAKGAMLCLYDRRTKAAEVQDAKGWVWRP